MLQIYKSKTFSGKQRSESNTRINDIYNFFSSNCHSFSSISNFLKKIFRRIINERKININFPLVCVVSLLAILKNIFFNQRTLHSLFEAEQRLILFIEKKRISVRFGYIPLFYTPTQDRSLLRQRFTPPADLDRSISIRTTSRSGSSLQRVIHMHISPRGSEVAGVMAYRSSR